MAQKIAKDLAAYCRSEFGGRLRAVTHYSSDDHDPIYTRPDLQDEIQLTEEMRTMFRSPLVQLQKAVRQLSSVHPTLDEPDFAMYSYGNITVIQLPMRSEEGIIVSIESESQLPADFEPRCKSILSGLEESIKR